jgi:phosphate transport system substrate-binding protein
MSFFAAAAISAAAFPSAANAAPTKIIISGSTSVYPLEVSIAKAFVKKYPGQAKFSILQGGSDIGIGDVAHGRVSIGASSRDQQQGDPTGLGWNKIARDGVCVVTNPDNGIANLSQAQVQDIFSGKVRRWDDVQGAKVTGPINLDVRTQASGTQDAFRNIFMGPSLNVAPSASQKASNGLVQSAVASDKNAIGYVDFRFTQGTHAVPYKGVACNLRNAKSGQYPGVRNFWFVTRGNPSGVVKKFIDYARSSSVQNSIVAKNYVPWHN